MDEYIKRADAINARGRSCNRKCAECDFAIDGDSWCEGEVFVVDLLRIPAADVRPARRGKWVGYPECLKYPNAYSDDHIVCSSCEECFSILDNDCDRFNFCPNCGADMREES